jgi:hypothetical protein
MHQVRVRYGGKVYNYTRDKYDHGVNRQSWLYEDEKMFLECLGLPKLEDDETVARERWIVSRLEKLLWYKNSLTLRSDFGKINASKLIKLLNNMIATEFEKEGFDSAREYEMMKMVEDAFKEKNYL